MEYTNGYKNRYAVYAHLKGNYEKTLSEYVYATDKVLAREEFKRKYPDYVIGNILLAKGLV